MDRRYVDTPRGRFATLGAGAPAAPLVLCAHGFPDHPHTFEALAGRLVDAGFRVVAPWMRGYAPSVLEGPYGPESIARDLIAITEALSPGEPSYLVGHDWGASAVYGATALSPGRFRAAVTLAVPHPLTFVRALVRSREQRRKSWYMAFFQLPVISDRRVRKDYFAFIDRLYRDWSPGFTPDAGYMDELKRCLSRSMPGPLEYYRATFRLTPARLWATRSDFQALTRIAVPTLYLHGADDGCIGPEVAAGQERFFKKEFRAVTVPRAGHFLHLEAPAEVAGHVLGWFTAAR
jgi:pimeloyl-ACP methyl ester carboxylesterase